MKLISYFLTLISIVVGAAAAAQTNTVMRTTRAIEVCINKGRVPTDQGCLPQGPCDEGYGYLKLEGKPAVCLPAILDLDLFGDSQEEEQGQ